MASYKELFGLYDLIENADVKSVERFLKSERSININDILPCKGIGIIHLAVGIEPVDKSIQCTDAILKYGGDPNLCSDEGVTPVHIAAIWGRIDNLKLLLSFGGDPLRQDIDGNTPCNYAAKEQQWDVYEYLSEIVEDNITDCPYDLNLDKVLVMTDQIVAEYCPDTNNLDRYASSFRKSDMVRDWCDKTTLIMNKLYPTILSETFVIHDKSLWTEDLSFVPNITLDETKTTYKSCFSGKLTDNLCISGVKRLEDTKIECEKPRLSLFENFSLPGSPINITHKNYNSKSTLKCEKQEMSVYEMQNKTNEWLSHSGSRGSDCGNEIESRSMTNVSSSFSSGGVMLATIQEEYKYEDSAEDVVLIEKRLLTMSVVLPTEDDCIELSNSCLPEKSIVSIASSLPSSVEYDNATLRADLLKLGFKPGPIDRSTRTLYLKKLRSLKKNPIVVTNMHGKTYSVELEKSLRTDSWLQDLAFYGELENKARHDFSNNNRKWREGTSKTSFTYLLLDPRLTNNLPLQANKQTQHESWKTFINSIFYVGKGKRSRPYAHLYQALALWKRDDTTTKDKKVQHILDIWSAQVGVVCLHIFQNVIPAEAYTYEAAMIDVLGVANLKNLKSGNYYGNTASWPLKERRMLGLYLLYKAMLIFLSEGERQLRPDDID